MSLAANCFRLEAVVSNGRDLYLIHREGSLYEVIAYLVKMLMKNEWYGKTTILGREAWGFEGILADEPKIIVITKQHAGNCVEDFLLSYAPNVTEEDEKEAEEYYWSDYKPPRVFVTEPPSKIHAVVIQADWDRDEG